jgi:hypothetical protein
MGFCNLPKPGYDETQSSWLFRCSVNRYAGSFKRLELAERPSRWWEGLELKSADPDVDFLSATRRLGQGRENIKPEILERWFSLRNGTAVEWNYRRFFCAECLRDDVASGRLPMWRKSWCYERSCICTVHDRELTALFDASRYSKAWDAFVQDCNSLSGTSAANNSMFSRFRSSTVTRIEDSTACDRIGQGTMLVDLFNRLFTIFLQSPYHGSRGGVARIHFQLERGMRFADPTSFEQSLLSGPCTADPPSRYGSLVFAASLLGVLPLSRFTMFADACKNGKTGMLIPTDLHRAAAFPYVDSAGYRVLHSYLGRFPRKEFPLLDRHLQLQEARYAREGVAAVHPFGNLTD